MEYKEKRDKDQMLENTNIMCTGTEVPVNDIEKVCFKTEEENQEDTAS